MTCWPSAASDHSIVITVEGDTYNRAQQILKGKPVTEFTSFKGVEAQRDVVDFILIQQALALGGLDLNYDFSTKTHDDRNLKLIKKVIY